MCTVLYKINAKLFSDTRPMDEILDTWRCWVDICGCFSLSRLPNRRCGNKCNYFKRIFGRHLHFNAPQLKSISHM